MEHFDCIFGFQFCWPWSLQVDIVEDVTIRKRSQLTQSLLDRRCKAAPATHPPIHCHSLRGAVDAQKLLRNLRNAQNKISSHCMMSALCCAKANHKTILANKLCSEAPALRNAQNNTSSHCMKSALCDAKTKNASNTSEQATSFRSPPATFFTYLSITWIFWYTDVARYLF